MKHLIKEYKQLLVQAADEIMRLRVAMEKAAQRAEDWPGSNDDPADVLADCVNILYAALYH